MRWIGMRFLAAVTLAACGSAPRPAPTAARGPAPAVPPASAPVAVQAPTTAPSGGPVAPPPASPPVAPSPPAAPVCLDRSQLELPTAVGHAPACDVPSRMIVVRAVAGAPVKHERVSVSSLRGSVKVYIRINGTLAKGSNRVGLEAPRLLPGGKAVPAVRCLAGKRISSSALGRDVLKLRCWQPERPPHAKGRPERVAGAGTYPGDGGLLSDSIAACSTAKRFALVTVTCSASAGAVRGRRSRSAPARRPGDPAGWTFRSTDAITLTIDPSRQIRGTRRRRRARALPRLDGPVIP